MTQKTVQGFTNVFTCENRSVHRKSKQNRQTVLKELGRGRVVQKQAENMRDQKTERSEAEQGREI